MNDMKHIDPEDLSLFAMQLLSPAEAAAIRSHLAGCSECQAELAASQADLEVLALSVEQATPSPAARERFLQQVATEKRIIPINRAAPAATNAPVAPAVSTPAAGNRLLPWLGWAVAAGVTFSAINLYRERGQMQSVVAEQNAQLQAQAAQLQTQTAQLQAQATAGATLSAEAARARAILDVLTDPNAMRVTLNTTPAAKALPQGRATYLAEKGTLIFIANNLQPLPARKVYELWLIPANGAAPIPAGTFHPDRLGNASVIAARLPKGLQAKQFGVTMEAEGGSQTPTLPILLAGG